MGGNPVIDNIVPETGRMYRDNGSVINVAEAFMELASAIYNDPDGDYEMAIIDVLHVAVHKKKMHTVSKRKAVAQNGFIRVLLTASATKDIHLRIGYACEDFAFFNTYSNVTNVVGGALITPFNRFIGEPSTITCAVLYDPTSFSSTEPRGTDFVGASGATSVRAGGTGSADIETIVKAGNSLLIELQRTETGSKYAGIILNLYERSPIV